MSLIESLEQMRRGEGGCPKVRLDRASEPYGPCCLLDEDHEGDCKWPYELEHDHVNGQCIPRIT